jgi:hypothetical protein
MNEQLQRTEATAADAVLTFFKQRLSGEDHTFTADQLRSYVNNNINGTLSPSTPDRILRHLRIQGKLGYVVLNRGRSLYEARYMNGVEVSAAPTLAEATIEQIQQRAYELYEQRGRTDGHELEDWIQAKEAITAVPIPAKEGWVVQRNDRGNWRESWNIGLHDETFDTEEAADIAIVAYGSQGEEYRAVRK